MIPVVTLKGEVLAPKAERVVHGGRGDYIEIADWNVLRAQIEVQPGQEYRLSPPWDSRVYYDWYRTCTGHFKLYFQRKTVAYADYKVGYWYIAPADLRSAHT